MKKVINELKYWGQILLLPIYGLSFLIPRNKKIWVFGSTFGNRFADNPKYFYLYVHLNKDKEIRPIWITKRKDIVQELTEHNCEAYLQTSWKGIWYSLCAGTYIFDNYSKDISFLCSGGAKKINLWHGIPLKKIQMDNKFDYVRHPKSKWKKIYWLLRRLSDEKPNHYVLATSKKLVPCFSSAFGTKNVLVSNYPRNDFLEVNSQLAMYTKEERHILEYIENKKNTKILLYMPTFRESESKFFELVNLKKLEQYLLKKNLVLLIKVHPKSKLKKKFKEIASGCIKHINSEVDPYSFLGKTDVLITDYSSIYFDYLLTDKPIIFFDYDREDYLQQSRELYYDYDTYTPGRKVKTMEELFGAIDEIETDEQKWKALRNQIRNEVFEQIEASGSENLYQQIKNILYL